MFLFFFYVETEECTLLRFTFQPVHSISLISFFSFSDSHLLATFSHLPEEPQVLSCVSDTTVSTLQTLTHPPSLYTIKILLPFISFT